MRVLLYLAAGMSLLLEPGVCRELTTLVPGQEPTTTHGNGSSSAELEEDSDSDSEEASSVSSWSQLSGVTPSRVSSDLLASSHTLGSSGVLDTLGGSSGVTPSSVSSDLLASSGTVGSSGVLDTLGGSSGVTPSSVSSDLLASSGTPEASGVPDDLGGSSGMLEEDCGSSGLLEEGVSSGDNQNASNSPLGQELINITTDILDTVARQGFWCHALCADVIAPTCIKECVRRGIVELTCKLFCYSVHLTCCQCPVPCHDPLATCYHACKEQDTACKDTCISNVQACCTARYHVRPRLAQGF